MTAAPPSIPGVWQDDSEEDRIRLEWEVPEVGAVIVLGTCGLLAVGGLVGGILESSDSIGGGGLFNSELTGAAVTVGASWASALLGLALLAVVGVGWWQAHAWDDALESDDDAADESAALGHIQRARRICRWATAALAVTFAGSVALLVGAILEGGQGLAGQTAARIVVEVVNAFCVAAISCAGWWVARQCGAGPVPSTAR